MIANVAFVVMVAVLAGAVLVGGSRKYSGAEIEAILSRDKEDIRESAAKYGVDPKIVASIISYNLATHDKRNALLESVALSANVVDRGNFFNLTRHLDFSIGLCQIKPRTAITAIQILERFDLKDFSDSGVSYGYSTAYELDDSWNIDRVRIVPFADRAPGKPELVRRLTDDRSSIEMCSYILSLYSLQWESAGYDLSSREEILMSLYFLGFRKSKPKADPRPVESLAPLYGKYSSAFIAKLFS